MTDHATQRTCLITGSRGYLGGRVKARFQQEGWNVVELTRNPSPEEVRAGRAIVFQLGENVSSEPLRGAEALVHCAHDFSLRDWRGIFHTNVLGGDKLFQAARAAGVKRQIFISSISAFEGCRSMYGQSKLEVEKRLAAANVLLVRPGLIYGDRPQGIFGNLVRQVAGAKVLPVFNGGSQVLYLTHDDDLCQMLCRHADGQFPAGPEPVTAAHEQGWPLRSILETVAQAQGKTVRYLSIPWRFAWLGLKTLELCHLPTRFRSDSLVSLVHQNLHPSFELTQRLGLKFRAFPPEPSALRPE